VLPLEVEAGHALLLHNWLIHRSGVNPSPVPRRAFSACYMDGRTLGTLTGQRFPMVFGEEPAGEHPFVEHLRGERRALGESLREAQAFAASLQEENAQLRRMREEAERYALTLEAARQSLTQEAERLHAALTASAQAQTQPPPAPQPQRRGLRGRLRGLARRLRPAAS
jgi:Sec-independent protein translocase protein TatA